MLAQTHLKQQLDALRHSTVSGFVRLRVAAHVDVFPGWLAAQTLYPASIGTPEGNRARSTWRLAPSTN
jgi:hypothetical protein